MDVKAPLSQVGRGLEVHYPLVRSLQIAKFVQDDGCCYCPGRLTAENARTQAYRFQAISPSDLDLAGGETSFGAYEEVDGKRPVVAVARGDSAQDITKGGLAFLLPENER